jgi:hypothetical protein
MGSSLTLLEGGEAGSSGAINQGEQGQKNFTN